ncbi:DUF4342 domain-containing protein [Lutispora thermophila]|uniref:DUF4342 domain-containing protein n=1 Tax=Lutispora thermophila DSM 19022 TaxID=1122184 RepID=A0A1M6ET24_9FIRM|nr:DUF4342 domain-containing protein [Lutispora thermophila]SHI88627.1 protein of unknown function [Lutispora thermophila DSM 19022]
MDITLDKIDIIRDRTGVSYKEAREALTLANGNVVDALINIEESNSKNWTETISVKGNELVDKLKSIVNTGNINRIRIKKDDVVILDIPVTAGAISALVMPKIAAIGTAAALMTKCTIEVERKSKGTVNVTEAVNNAVSNVADKVKDLTDDLRTENQASNVNNPDTNNDESDGCCPEIDTQLP